MESDRRVDGAPTLSSHPRNLEQQMQELASSFESDMASPGFWVCCAIIFFVFWFGVAMGRRSTGASQIQRQNNTPRNVPSRSRMEPSRRVTGLPRGVNEFGELE